MKLIFKTKISLPFQTIKEHFNQELFVYLAPGIIPFNLKRFDGCKPGDEVHIDLGVAPLKQNWVSIITSDENSEDGWSFVDEGRVLPWPLKYWKHHHRVDKISENESCIVDDIIYECSPSFLTPIMKLFFWPMFAIRPKRYKKFFKDKI
jgi:ligand-binding SRPBCC domain-containing protein